MQYIFIIGAAVFAPFVAAHGKISLVEGDAGGNGTAIAIKGGAVPGSGSNDVTEVDTTVFGSTKIRTDGLGRTTGGGQNTVDMVAQTMQLSGNTLPQVSANGGFITGVYHIVTTDGAGPVKAIIDPTATGEFSKGTKAHIAIQVPGHKGNIHPDGTVMGRSPAITGRSLVKRAANVDKDFPIRINIPAGTQCTGTVAGQQNVCFLKIANSNPAGPFGGTIAFQMAGAGEAASKASTSTTTSTGCDSQAAAAKRDAPLFWETEEDDNIIEEIEHDKILN